MQNAIALCKIGLWNWTCKLAFSWELGEEMGVIDFRQNASKLENFDSDK